MTFADFAAVSRAGAERFLQTVLVIDNELTLQLEPGPPPGAAATTPSNSLKDRRRASPPPATAAPEPEPPAPAPPKPFSSPLDAKEIMDAFLRRSMICGMHKPASGDELVAEAIRAARRSDAVIVDWLLDGTDPSAAKNIIAGILKGDADENGRLRLIAVYTSEPDIAAVATQIRDHLSDGTLTDRGEGILANRNTRIVIFNKAGTTGAPKPVAVSDLPTRIVDEFAHLTAGILSTFAVTAIAAVRRETHHVLSIFSEELDGAFLGHMCAIPSPEDAREFALDLLAGELRSVASMSASTNDVLSPGVLALRIDALSKDGALWLDRVKVPVEVARGFPEGGLDKVESSRTGGQLIEKNKRWDPPSKAEAVTERNVGYIFHSGAGTAEEAHLRFARFSSFKTERFDRTTLPDGWVPTLMLGSIIAELDADGNPKDYLLCTQPRCDAVRFEAKRSFPFQTVEVVTKAPFEIVAAIPGPTGKPETVLMRVRSKPHEGRMIEFDADTTKKAAVAVRTPEGGYVFTDHSKKRRFLWIGELREMTAQRSASKVAARMHDVGLDEYEWQRIQASGK